MKNHDNYRLEVIGKNIQAYLRERKDRGDWYQIRALAEHAGISESHADNIIHARRQSVGYDTLGRISEALGVSVPELTMSPDERLALDDRVTEYEQWAKQTLPPELRRWMRGMIHASREMGADLSLPALNAMLVARSMQ